MTEKRVIGSVWCTTDIDSYGKCINGWVPLSDIVIKDDGTTLGAFLNAKDNEIVELKEQVSKLTVLVEKQQRATKEAFGVIINGMYKEKFL